MSQIVIKMNDDTGQNSIAIGVYVRMWVYVIFFFKKSHLKIIKLQVRSTTTNGY